MPDQKHYPLFGYLLSILLVTASLVITLVLWPEMRETPFVLLFFAVLLSAWRGGYGPGLAATALSAFISKLFLIQPLHSLSFSSRADFLRLLVFIFNSLLFVWLFSTRKAAEEKLRSSEESLRELFENANDIIYVHDLEGNYTSINKVGERITGYTREEALKMNVTDVVAPEYLELARGMLASKLADVKPQTFYQLEVITKDGRRVPLEISTQLIYEEGKPVGVQGIARDITKRKLAEEALRESEERYRELFENANDLVYTHDLKGNFTSLNLAGQRITGYTLDEALGLNIAQVVLPKYLKTAREMIELKSEDELPTRYELEIFAKDGRRIPLEVSTRVILKGGQPVGVQGIARDITERKRTEETLRSLSLLDDLTGLYNRRGFLALAEQQVRLTQRTGHGFTLVFADLDGLKQINDRLGHRAGDEALRTVAEILKKSFRESDIIARLSGDEFTILALEDYEAPANPAVTARLWEKLEEYKRQDSRPFDLSLSVGVVHFDPESGGSLEELISQADKAMYQDKQSKRDKQSKSDIHSELVL
ncbi:MAG TPA: PAS domain S-box protein [Pyrinomonadaceae bacterium]|jgi:diguanylate cyclase (GGDEF)-like protein/PAS domain S-box-containing protein